MSLPLDAGRDVLFLSRCVRDALAWLGEAPDARGVVAPAVSRWSPRMQIDHAALATSSVCRAVERILDRDPRCVPPGPRAEPLAAILAAGAIPRGRAEAPDPMRPTPDVSHQAACVHLLECGERIDALVPRAAEIAAATLRAPHFALGPMTGSEWLRFACIHFDHHVRIAREAATAG